MRIFFTAEKFCSEDILFRRRFVTGDVLYIGDVLYGDILSRRRFVRRRFVRTKSR
jgi:hypothetical protein